MKKFILDIFLNIVIGALTIPFIAGPIYLLKNAPDDIQVLVTTVIVFIAFLILSACVGSIIRMLWGIITDDEEYYPPSY